MSPNKPQPTLLPALEQTLKTCARAVATGQWAVLAATPLADHPLVTELPGVAQNTDATGHGLAVYALLQWAIDQLQPPGKPDWSAFAWRSYLILYHAYLHDRPFAELAERLAISEQTVYQSRRNAVARLAQIVADEATHQHNAPERAAYWLGCRYQHCPQGQQAILRLLVVLQQPVPPAIFTQLVNHATGQSPAAVASGVQQLCVAGLLQDATTFSAHSLTPALQTYLCGMQIRELITEQRLVAAFYASQADPLTAADYLLLAGDDADAATRLLAQQRALINQGQAAALLTQLQRCRAAHVPEADWVKVKLLTGDLALQLQDVPAALGEYQQALTAEAAELRAQVYHRRGRALLALNLDEALLHFDLALETLHTRPEQPLWVQIQTDRILFFMDSKPDLPRAERLLRELTETVPTTNKLGQSYLANGWQVFYHHRGQPELALEQGQRAWLLAIAAQEQDWMMHTCRNLGNQYAEAQCYDQALHYYTQSRDLAVALEDRAMVALGDKALGECYFGLADYARAAGHYQAAYATLQAVKRQNWLAAVCYDLAEAYAHLWDYPAMQHYATEGVQLCRALRDDYLWQMFHDLQNTFGWLTTLNERQLVGVKQAKASGAITNRDYQALTHCAQRQAVRDLNELCEQGILQRVGEGRATCYVPSRYSKIVISDQ